MAYLFSTDYLDTLMMLASGASKLLSQQPMLAVAKAPCRVFGDIHGQVRDLLLICRAFGFPGRGGGAEPVSFVFNGDFVDRGAHQLEAIGVLLALKVLYPEQVWLIRGNHEDRSMNERYGFREECDRKLGKDSGAMTFSIIENAFDRLPVACLISEKILVVHGGIGDGKWMLSDINTIPRPLKSDTLHGPAKRWIYNILWSDPIEDGQDADPNIFGVHESPRGGIVAKFAWNITKTFCARNGVSLIIRSHQSKKRSRGFDVMHENMLSRVLGARLRGPGQRRRRPPHHADGGRPCGGSPGSSKLISEAPRRRAGLFWYWRATSRGADACCQTSSVAVRNKMSRGYGTSIEWR